MPKYEIKVVEPFAYSERNYATGDVLGSIETEMSPVMLLEFQRVGRAAIVSPDAPAAGVGSMADKTAPPVEPSTVAPLVEGGGEEALASLDAAGPVGDVGSTEATAADAPAELPGELAAETPEGLAMGDETLVSEAAAAEPTATDPPLTEPTVEELTTETQGDLEPEAPAAAPAVSSRKKAAK